MSFVLIYRLVDDVSPMVGYSGPWTDSLPTGEGTNYKVARPGGNLVSYTDIL